MNTESPPPAWAVAPPLRRRLACFLYEGVLLFGVVMAAGFAYSTITQQRHALHGMAGLQAVLFAVLGLYFIVCWRARGQTLAMQTWRIRLVDRHGQRVGWGRALARYTLSWIWFAPALLAVKYSGLKGSGITFTLLSVGVLTYALLSRLRHDRQFWHDVACGTRLVEAPPPPPPSKR